MIIHDEYCLITDKDSDWILTIKDQVACLVAKSLVFRRSEDSDTNFSRTYLSIKGPAGCTFPDIEFSFVEGTPIGNWWRRCVTPKIPMSAESLEILRKIRAGEDIWEGLLEPFEEELYPADYLSR